ncbi:MAG: trehalose-phosphatase, partial [Calditrichia bacterium]
KILNPNIKPEKLYQQITGPDRKILLLDYDGTLAPFKTDPSHAVPYPGIRELLQKLLLRSDVRLVVISGRATRDLIPLLGLEQPPEIWGSHGIERLMPAAGYEQMEIPAIAASGLQTAKDWLQQTGWHKRGEEKPGCYAVHWRGMPPPEVQELKEQAEKRWQTLAGRHGLELKQFDGGLELRVPGRTKADAVLQVLEEESGSPLTVYLGDDLTDEDAFRTLKGRGVGFLVREEFRETQADIWIQPPQELMDFLQRWIK